MAKGSTVLSTLDIPFDKEDDRKRIKRTRSFLDGIIFSWFTYQHSYTQQEHLNNKNGRIDFLTPADLDFHDCHLELGGNSHYIMYCMKMIVDSINTNSIWWDRQANKMMARHDPNNKIYLYINILKYHNIYIYEEIFLRFRPHIKKFNICYSGYWRISTKLISY
jgi:hypothetical protein